jgi:DNA-binding LacI/PurR family transcriptional regulator
MLMALEQALTAIFAFSDLRAVGAICALQQVVLRIPQDVAIVGFNDIPMAAFVSPRLTTVAAPAYQMGWDAMVMLQNLIAGKQPPQG